jgi:hypothetical protein
MEGRLISNGVINQEISTIEIDNYASGKYIIVIKNADKTIKGSFILK